MITWTNIMIIVATLLGTTILLKYSDIFFTLVVIWALYGIMSKRMAVGPLEFATTITTTQICMAFIAGAITTRVLLKK